MRYLPADGTKAGGDFYEAIGAARRPVWAGGRRHRRPRAGCRRGDGPTAQRAARLRARGALTGAGAAAPEPLRRRRDGARAGATLVYAVVDPAAREIRYASAGASAGAPARRRRAHPLPRRGARRAAGPRARARLRGRDDRGGGRTSRSSCTPTARSSGATSRSTRGWSGSRAPPRWVRGSSPRR